MVCEPYDSNYYFTSRNRSSLKHCLPPPPPALPKFQTPPSLPSADVLEIVSDASTVTPSANFILLPSISDNYNLLDDATVTIVSGNSTATIDFPTGSAEYFSTGGSEPLTGVAGTMEGGSALDVMLTADLGSVVMWGF